MFVQNNGLRFHKIVEHTICSHLCFFSKYLSLIYLTQMNVKILNVFQDFFRVSNIQNAQRHQRLDSYTQLSNGLIDTWVRVCNYI